MMADKLDTIVSFRLSSKLKKTLDEDADKNFRSTTIHINFIVKKYLATISNVQEGK